MYAAIRLSIVLSMPLIMLSYVSCEVVSDMSCASCRVPDRAVGSQIVLVQFECTPAVTSENPTAGARSGRVVHIHSRGSPELSSSRADLHN